MTWVDKVRAMQRPYVLVLFTGVVVYMAIRGSADAQRVIVEAAILIVGALWGERAATKRLEQERKE